MEFNTNFVLSIKLNDTNYHVWYKQVNLFLIARDLEGNVTGTTKCHPSTIGTGEAASANHTHSLFIRQDKLIYLALLGSGNSKARSVMVATDTSHETWLALTRVFSNQSESRVMSLQQRLSSIAKGNSFVPTYLHSICNIDNELALIGHPIDNLEMVIRALNGLGPTFIEFTTSIRTRDSPISFSELYGRLVDFEMFLQRKELISMSNPITTNTTHHHYG